MIKVTSKTLIVNFETEVKLGKNDAIELTLVHQAFIYAGKNGNIDCDLELADFTNVKFLKANASELGSINEKFDAVFSCFLFHELPKAERVSVFESAKSALKKENLGQFHIDSIQYGDIPEFDFALTNFPAHFHEPFYMNYVKTPYSELLPEGCLHSEKRAFLSKLVHIYSS